MASRKFFDVCDYFISRRDVDRSKIATN